MPADSEADRLEAMVLHLLATSRGVEDVVLALTRDEMASFVANLYAAHGGAWLAELLGRNDIGGAVQQAMEAVATALVGDAKPWRALSDEVDAFAVDAIRRMVRLRLVGGMPAPQVALAMCMGVGLIGSVHGQPIPFGAALAAWCRLMRMAPFLDGLNGRVLDKC
jgi:hypothetical protein